jgi:hypothetical protein
MALEEIIWQIKKHWSITRKVHWLQVNGKHESQITEWPKESAVEIRIRGLGAGGFEDDDNEFPDDDAYNPEETNVSVGRERTKHPKGIARLSIFGRIFRISNKLTFSQVYRKHF